MAMRDYLTMKGVGKVMATGLAGVVLSGAVCAGNVGNAYADRLTDYVTSTIVNSASREIGRRIVDRASGEDSEDGNSYHTRTAPTIEAYRWDDKDGDGYVSQNEIGDKLDGALDTSESGIFFKLNGPRAISFGLYDSNRKLVANIQEKRRINKGFSLPEKIGVEVMDENFDSYAKSFEVKQK